MGNDAHQWLAPWRAEPLRSSRALVLLCALLLHAALLLIPLRQADGPDVRRPVEVEFVRQLPPATPQVEPEPEPLPAQPTPEPAPEPVIAEQPMTDALVQAEPEEEQPHADIVITAAYLYDSVANLEWSEPEAPPLMLGRSVRGELPRNLVSPVLPWTPNWFDGMAAPGEVEVLDRWTEPDGSMMMVMRTPSGQTVCGRGAAWDPLNPLVENVMMFRTCGGGGKRTRPAP